MLVPALVLACTACTASAAIFTGRPANATVGVGGEVFRISWVDDSKQPSLAEIGNTTIELCLGSRDAHECPQVAGTVDLAAQKDLNFTVDPRIGEDGQYYFFKYTADNYTSYTTRFFLKDMQGEFTESQEALVKDLAVNPMPTESAAAGGAAAHAAASAGPTTSAAAASATPSEATDGPKAESASRRVGASLAVAAVAVVAGLALF